MPQTQYEKAVVEIEERLDVLRGRVRRFAAHPTLHTRVDGVKAEIAGLEKQLATMRATARWDREIKEAHAKVEPEATAPTEKRIKIEDAYGEPGNIVEVAIWYGTEEGPRDGTEAEGWWFAADDCDPSGPFDTEAEAEAYAREAHE